MSILNNYGACAFRISANFVENQPIKSVSLSPMGFCALALTADEVLHYYDLYSAKKITMNEMQGTPVDLISFVNADDSMMHTTSSYNDYSIGVRNLMLDKEIMHLYGHESRIKQLCLSPMSEFVFLSTALDNSVRLWDFRLMNCVRMLNISNTSLIAYNPTNDSFALGIDSKKIKYYDVRNTKSAYATYLRTIKQDEYTFRDEWTNLEYSPDGKKLLISTNGPKTLVCTIETGDMLEYAIDNSMDGEDWLTRTASFSMDSRFLFLGTADKGVYAWNLETGEHMKIWNMPKDMKIDWIKYNPKFHMLISYSNETLSRWYTEDNGIEIDMPDMSLLKIH